MWKIGKEWRFTATGLTAPNSSPRAPLLEFFLNYKFANGSGASFIY